ncbi:MAG: DUF5714 domain-containing protein [Eubacteriales bacterium]|nr:DUF5714 domain-containing protein [Eubacteriales bacterium]MDD3199817.1 DUF5714 domain-containing protein [Eubacteriales bacterium]MDD4121736.1 DUF5714 domain-containing protein [Eubacteriales bacterium]MDD4630328.1 DUF5714 domain-containing protein [Eubacteriales bacterium]
MNTEACCCTNTDHITGCMVCGRELFYTPDKPLRANCFYCGKEYITHVFCLEGHYVCDECHSRDILELIEYECINSNQTDPVELALKIFDLPTLHMHGPEYHSIVPAVLVTAYCNSINMKDDSFIKEAISRGKELFGGLCGTHGACGACIGVGIAYSVIHQVTPYSKEDRGKANQMTAHALMAISRMGGPRCCKRDSMIAIETAINNFECFSNTGKISYVCKQFPYNDKCIKSKCLYYPLKYSKMEYDNA